MLGGQIDMTEYSEKKTETRRTSLNLEKENITFLEQNGKNRSQTANKVLKKIRENPELQKQVIK